MQDGNPITQIPTSITTPRQHRNIWTLGSLHSKKSIVFKYQSKNLKSPSVYSNSSSNVFNLASHRALFASSKTAIPIKKCTHLRLNMMNNTYLSKGYLVEGIIQRYKSTKNLDIQNAALPTTETSSDENKEATLASERLDNTNKEIASEINYPNINSKLRFALKKNIRIIQSPDEESYAIHKVLSSGKNHMKLLADTIGQIKQKEKEALSLAKDSMLLSVATSMKLMQKISLSILSKKTRANCLQAY